MHKLECSPMVVFGENWNPSETVRLTARILAKQVRNWDLVQVGFILFFLKGQKDEHVTPGGHLSPSVWGPHFPSHPFGQAETTLQASSAGLFALCSEDVAYPRPGTETQQRNSGLVVFLFLMLFWEKVHRFSIFYEKYIFLNENYRVKTEQ